MAKLSKLFTSSQMDAFYEDHTQNAIHQLVADSGNPKELADNLLRGLNGDVWGASEYVGAWLVLMSTDAYPSYLREAAKLVSQIRRLASEYSTDIGWFSDAYGDLEEVDPDLYEQFHEKLVGAWETLASALGSHQIPFLVSKFEANKVYAGLKEIPEESLNDDAMDEGLLYDKIWHWWSKLSKGGLIFIYKNGGHDFYGGGRRATKKVWLLAGKNPDIKAIIWSPRSTDALTFFVRHLQKFHSPKGYQKLVSLHPGRLRVYLLNNLKQYYQKSKVHTTKDYTFKGNSR